jgi:hypothetical protein
MMEVPSRCLTSPPQLRIRFVQCTKEEEEITLEGSTAWHWRKGMGPEVQDPEVRGARARVNIVASTVRIEDLVLRRRIDQRKDMGEKVRREGGVSKKEMISTTRIQGSQAKKYDSLSGIQIRQVQLPRSSFSIKVGSSVSHQQSTYRETSKLEILTSKTSKDQSSNQLTQVDRCQLSTNRRNLPAQSSPKMDSVDKVVILRMREVWIRRFTEERPNEFSKGCRRTEEEEEVKRCDSQSRIIHDLSMKENGCTNQLYADRLNLL